MVPTCEGFFGVLRHEMRRLGVGERQKVRCTVGPKKNVGAVVISWGVKKILYRWARQAKKEPLCLSWECNFIFFFELFYCL